MNYKLKIPKAKTSDGEIEVVAPFDGKTLGTVEAADQAAVEAALATAFALFEDKRRHLRTEERLKILDRAREIMQTQIEDLAKLAASEGGKPLIDSRAEVLRAIDGLRVCVETMRTQSGSEIPMNLNAASMHKLAFTSHEPIGVVVAISAFNHPLNLVVHQVAPAVATGCPVIIKPAEDTPLSCFRFLDILKEAGLPEEYCQALVVRDFEVATRLATDRRVAFFSFIGSARVGWSLRSKLSWGTRCVLEHGGSAPVIFAPDANSDLAVPKLLKGGFYHAGQVCVSVQRVFVHESRLAELQERLVAGARKLRVGDPLLPETEVGPLIRPREVDRIESWIEEARRNPETKILCGGKRMSDSCYECTIVLDPPRSSLLNQQEIFGPVICLYSYSDLDDAICQANAVPFSFQAAVFTENIETALKAYRGLNATAIMVNEHTAFRVDWMPFGGLKESGLGIGGIPYTIRNMQVEKMLVLSSPKI